MKVSLLVQVILVALCLVGSEVSAQTTSDTMSMSNSNSWTNSNSMSWTSSWTNSMSMSWTSSWTNSMSMSWTPSYSNSNSMSMSYSNSNSMSWSNSYSTSLSVSYSTGHNYLPVTGLTDTCPTDAAQICLTFTVPANNPPYTSFLVTVNQAGSTTPVTVTTTTNSITLTSTNAGLKPGQSYTIFVQGVVNNVKGPQSPSPLATTLPSQQLQGTNPYRINNVGCFPQSGSLVCTWTRGKKNYSKLRLLVRCSAPTYYNFATSFFVNTFDSTITSISAQLPKVPVTGATSCYAILRTQYPQTQYGDTRMRFTFTY